MKKSLMRSLFFVIMTIAVIISINTVTIAAQDDAVCIKLGDKLLSVEDTRLMEDGRTYAPYESLFAAVGAKASYDEENGTVSGVIADTTVIFTLDDCFVEVNGESYYIDAFPFEDIDTGVIYIPVRYTAQALGYVVGWDEATSSISLQSVEDLITASGATYSVMDKIMDSQKSFNNKNYEIDGTLNVSLDMSAVEDFTPLTVAGDISGVTAGSNAEMSVSLKTNISEFMADFMPEDEIDLQTMMMLSMLNDIDMEFIVNSEEGMIYMQSPLLSLLFGLTDDTWLSIDLGTYVSGDIKLEELLSGSFSDILCMILKSINVSDNGDEIAEILMLVNSVISDQAMVKEGDNYVFSTKFDDESSISEVKIVFAFDKDEFAGISVEITEENEMLSGSMSFTYDADGKVNMEFSMSSPDGMSIEMTADFTFTETDKVPASAPKDGSTIIPMEDILSGIMELVA
ncbi:MAG: copper amine oxidase N-terminal domain-containing protein [Eubacteriales bacterium]